MLRGVDQGERRIGHPRPSIEGTPPIPAARRPQRPAGGAHRTFRSRSGTGKFRCGIGAASPRLRGVDLSHLGTAIGPMTRVHGGFANRMYRLDTDQGSFAVKELNLVDRRSTYHAEDVFRFEQAAFAAGVPMPEPISASHDALVHRWVEGEKVPEAPVSAAYAFEVGEILARIHALDVEWTHVSTEEPTSRDWPGPSSPSGRRRPDNHGPTSSPPTSRCSSRLRTSSTPAKDPAPSC